MVSSHTIGESAIPCLHLSLLHPSTSYAYEVGNNQNFSPDALPIRSISLILNNVGSDISDTTLARLRPHTYVSNVGI